MKKLIMSSLATIVIATCAYSTTTAVSWQQFGQDSNGIQFALGE